jgi:poly(A) polymerase/tRNA nucleotidyltransferase (CCA-adding enzyme)
MKQSINKNVIPQHVSRVTETLKNAGFQAFLVGGCVRDLVMGKQPKDWDITTDAVPEEIIGVFTPLSESLNPHPASSRMRPSPLRGEGENPLKVVYENTFGTVALVNESEPLDSPLRQIEITPFRTETTYSDHRHPDAVVFAKTLQEDLSRRDFTMNALAYDIQNDILNDMYGGQNDISKRHIKTVGDARCRFEEDALRILRAIRFSAQLDFIVSHETMEAMFHVKHLLKNVSIERIRDEFIKIIDSKNPIIGIGLMKQLGILEMIIPELLEGDKCFQGGVHKYDVLEHLLHACQHAADKNYPFHVKLAALFHDIGKPRTKREGKLKPTFYGHEVVGAKMTKKIMERMKFPKSDIEIVTKYVRWHMFMSDTEAITLSAVRRMIANVSEQPHPNPLLQGEGAAPEHPIWDLMKVRECDRVGMAKTEAPYRLRKYFAMIEECLRDPISVSQLKVDGNHLMNTLHVKPGPRMGWMLHALLEEVIENPEKNTVEYLSDRVKQLELLDDNELKQLGEQGKQLKEQADEQEVKKLHVKHGVKK